ncbi:MAG: carbohydrate kinase family protein [Candidatus Taylorbacteria bacterium]|nr:carbohydrate kinase family protein [Candidatus Taylorbacteria bacterium]
MFGKPLDILSIGDITTDAFIRLQDAEIHCDVDRHGREICLPFGKKIPFEYVKVVKAVGNAANAAVASARLGLRTALIANIGDDQNGKDCTMELQKNGVSTSFVKANSHRSTNYHFVLWYDVDRTILVNHIDYDYRLPKIAPTKWIYLTSLPANTLHYHMEIAEHLEAHPDIKLAFQPGTFQINLGMDELKRLYTRTDVFVLNTEEAQKILKTDSHDLKMLMKKIYEYGPKLVAITDNTNGAYLFDGDHYYHMPIYPDPRPAFERTGCGDAWSSTFVSALAMGKTPLEALTWAPVNPMSVAQFIGSQEGLLTREQLEWWLNRAPDDYRPREI